MEDRSSKLYTGLCGLVLIWIGVYWAWEPGGSTKPRISISTPELTDEPDDDPIEEPAQIEEDPQQPSTQSQE